MPIAAITPMVQCAKVVSMSPQDPNAATNWRKTNQGVSTQDQTCVHHIYNCTLIAVTFVRCTNSVKIDQHQCRNELVEMLFGYGCCQQSYL